MRKLLLTGLTLAGLLSAATAQAQFGQNLPGQGPAANANFLPRYGGGPWLNSQQFYPNGYGNPLNNYYNNAFYGNTGYNPYGGVGGGTPWNSPFANPWQNNGFGGGFNNNGFNNPFAGGFGGGFNGPMQNTWGFGNNVTFIGPAAPFGGYGFNGYGNFAPIVGVNNGWWPYQAPYNYNNPIDMQLQNLYMQGLNFNKVPSSK